MSGSLSDGSRTASHLWRPTMTRSPRRATRSGRRADFGLRREARSTGPEARSIGRVLRSGGREARSGRRANSKVGQGARSGGPATRSGPRTIRSGGRTNFKVGRASRPGPQATRPGRRTRFPASSAIRRIPNGGSQAGKDAGAPRPHSAEVKMRPAGAARDLAPAGTSIVKEQDPVNVSAGSEPPRIYRCRHPPLSCSAQWPAGHSISRAA